jgi:hypothetical protein
MNNMIKNPLITNQELNSINREYNNIYILTLKENISGIDESIYNYNINKELYDEVCKYIILIKAPYSIIYEPNHYNKISILSKNTIDKFNVNNYELEDNNLVIFILNMSYDNVRLYLLQYEKKNTLVDIYKTIIINKYFNNDFKNNKLLEILKNNISNIYESNYWTKLHNCSHNLSLFFKKRIINNKNIEETKVESEDYLRNISKTKYSSISKILHFKYKIYSDNNFSKENIYNLILELPERERFILFSNLIISKNYSHLALNNKELLLFMKPIIHTYIQLFRYLFGYAWIRFYIEESIKHNITKDDQFIFDIDTASELPLFPFCMTKPKLNPYCTILVDDNILNSENNLGGIFYYKEKITSIFKNDNYKCFSNNGIAKLDEFKKNLNVFLTGNQNKNIFENINWEKLNIAISGSALCACIQKHHPLIDLFSNFNEEDKLNRYYNEYYANADVDVIFMAENTIDFIDKVNEFYDQISINICNLNSYATKSDIKLECKKNVFMFITKNDIDNIILKNPTLNYKYIIDNINEPNINNLFSELFETELEKYKKNFFEKISDENIEIYKNKYTDYITFDNLTFIIKLSKKTDIKNYKSNISITYKYYIYSNYIYHKLELFIPKNRNSFMTVVQHFHLPCVRGYYDGSNVYLTPSCISAHLTYMNLDYKYFAGIRNPIDIINKYRMRGFGTWLNDKEKKSLFKYSSENQIWNNVYCINISDENTLISNYGSLKINHKMFRPRLFNPNEYINALPIDIQLGYSNNIISSENIQTNYEYLIELNEMYKNKNSKYLELILENLQTINPNGTINPVEKWIIDFFWYNFNH